MTCFTTVKDADGRVRLITLPVLNKPQYEMAPYKDLFDDAEKTRLATEGHLGTTKVMKDFVTGRECECYVSFHEPTKRINTLPVDSIKIPTEIYNTPIPGEDRRIVRAGGSVEVKDIKRRNGPIISGTLRVDANRRDVYFTTGGDRTLKVGKKINGAPITASQQKQLEERKMVFVANMFNPRTGKRYSDDVRYSDSNILLVGNAARRYRSKLNPDGNPATTQRTERSPRRSVAALPPQKKGGKKQSAA